jgi:hypothetical protein
MPSTNKTPLGLNLWEGTDHPKKDDFNMDNLKADMLISGLQEGKANKIAPVQHDLDLENGITAYRKSTWLKTQEGIVVVNAQLKGTFNFISGQIVARLPAEARPQGGIYEATARANNYTMVIIQIDTDGYIKVFIPAGSSLDQAFFTAVYGRSI